MNWHAFQRHPELYDDIKPHPYFVEDWLLALNPTLIEMFMWTSSIAPWSVYVGPQGSLSPLHQDFWHTHSYLAQIQGRKRVILVSPRDSEFLYGGRVDPEQPDLDRFPLCIEATFFEGVIEPGDVLFTPRDWWHYVRGIDNTITVSHNFFNHVNFAEHLCWIMRKLPTLIDGFQRHPEWRDKLRTQWTLRDFAGPDC